MKDHIITLLPGGAVRLAGNRPEMLLGYSGNRGNYRIKVTATGEWQGLTIRAVWHTQHGTFSTLVEDSAAEVPDTVTAQAGEGCVTFEGTDGNRTVTSADLHYRVSANSGTDDGQVPEPGTNAWEAFVAAMREAAGGISTTEKQTLLALLRTLAADTSSEARKAYNALAALWGEEPLPESDPLTARLGKAILGKMRLGRK